MTSTTTQLLILHEREKQVRPRTNLNVVLTALLADCALLSATIDSQAKPAKKKRK